MLYLIETTYYEKETGLILDLLKIGYTKDDKETEASRFRAYKLHNPGCKILYKIPGLSDYYEKLVINKFNKYTYDSYGREWFYWNQGIINFFEDLNSDKRDEVISNLVLEYNSKNPPRLHLEGKTRNETKDIIDFFRLYLNILSVDEESITKSKVDEIIESCFSQGISDLSGLLSYLGIIFPDKISKFKEKLNILETDKDLGDMILKYYNLTVDEKYKFLCETVDGFSQKKRDLFLSYISDFDSIKSNYLILGPVELKAACYKRAEIERRKGVVLFDENKLISEIFRIFNIGETIPTVILKPIITKIYKEVGYDKTPKAIDIKNYFNIKVCSVWRDLDGTGEKKKVNAYKLLSVKPGYQEDYDRIKSKK